MNFQSRQQPSADNCTDDSNELVAKKTKSTAFNDNAG